MNGMDVSLRPGAVAVDRRGTAAATGERSRVAGFDVLRLAALTAVVAFHAGAPGAGYTAWRMPALTIITTALVAGRGEPRPLAEQARRSASRLLIPWLFWCAVYAAIDACFYLKIGKCLLDELGVRVLLTGTSIHLWYLPFAFVMVLAVNAARRATDRMPPAAIGAVAAVVAVAALVIVARDGTYRLESGPTPWPQWLRVVPAVFLGLAVGTVTRRLSGRELAVVAAAVAAAGVAAAAALGDELPARYAVAIVLVASATRWRSRPPRWLAEAAGLGMGVYLVHIAVYRVVYAATHRLPTPDPSPTVLALMVVALSFAAAWGLSRTPLKRFV